MSQTKAQLIDPVDGSIVNADINASAAIAGSKIDGSSFASITSSGSIVISQDNAIHFNATSGNDQDAILRENSGNVLLINSRNDAILNIDSNNDSTDAHFAVAHGAATSSSTELFRVQENGNVGIGTASPTETLHVEKTVAASSDLDSTFLLLKNASDGGSAIEFINSVNGKAKLSFGVEGTGASTDETFIGFSTSLNTTLSEAMRIDSSGRLLLGDTSPYSTDAIITALRSSVSRIGVGNTNTSATGECGVDFLPSNTTVGARIECKATEDFSTVANRTADLIFETRKDGVLDERMRILSDGKVGIGENSPTRRLHVEGSDADADICTFKNTNTTSGFGVNIQGGGTDNNRYILRLAEAGGTEKLRVDSSGNLGIGTTSPSSLVHLNSSGDTQLLLQSGSDTFKLSCFSNGEAGIETAGANPLRFLTNASESMRITDDGHVGIGTTTPDLLGSSTDSTYLAVIETSGTRRGQLLLGDNQNVDNGGIGDIHFVGHYQNASHKDMAAIRAMANGSTSGQRGADLTFSTKKDGTANVQERMIIDSDGNVGIGTSSPTHLLHLESASSPSINLLDTTNNCKLLVYSQDADAHIGTYSNHPLVFDTNSTEKMRILSDGKVGIGTSSPTTLFSIDRGDSSSSCALFENQDNTAYSSSAEGHINSVLVLKSTTSTGQNDQSVALQFNLALSGQTGSIQEIGSVRTGSGKGALFFRTRNSSTGRNERMRLDDAGNLLVGRTSVGNTGNGHVLRGVDSAIFSRNSDSGETIQICRNTNDGPFVEFRAGDSGNASILATIAKSGSSVVYNTSSDYRLKENVTAISDGITRLKTLKPYRFNFKSHPDRTVDGFFAHEVTAVPEAITGAKDGTKDILYTEEDTIPS